MSSGGHGGRRRGKKHEEEEHENHERWMVSYADMLTLLFVLFVVLFAMSQVDKEKFAALAKGLSASFGGPITVQPGPTDRKSTRLNSSHANISYAVFCLKKKKNTTPNFKF